jgi:hypothetical protein
MNPKSKKDTAPNPKIKGALFFTHGNIFNAMYPQKKTPWLSGRRQGKDWPCASALSLGHHVIHLPA